MRYAHVGAITRWTRITAVALLAAVGVLMQSAPVSAAAGQAGGQQVTLNPGGGILTNGSDGLRFTINAASGGGNDYDSVSPGQDGVVYRQTRQYCCSAGAPMLNIGGALFGQSGPAISSGNWTSIQVIETSGAAAVGARTSATGSASATVRYTAVHSGLTYTMDRTVTYTYPNDFVVDTYSVTIPTGNTSTVKFYLGGDTAPGSSDQGYGIMLTSPVRTVISLNTSSQIMFGFREVPGSKVFDGATSQSFSTPYATVANGGNIGFIGMASNHDAGLMMQWNLGSAPGTQTASLEQFATQQGTNLNAAYSSAKVEAGSSVQLNISVVNTLLTTASGLAYTFTLPSGLTVASAAPTNSCGGTLSAAAGGTTISLAGASAGSAANCVVSVPVTSSVNGNYTISAASASALSGLTNNIGTSIVSFTNDNDNDGVINAVEQAAPNSGDANLDGQPDKDQLNVTSFVSPVTNKYTTVTTDDDCELTSASVIDGQSAGAVDSDYEYPFGLLDFTADCGTPGFTTTITQYYFDPPTSDFVLRKLAGGVYQTVTGATITMTTVAGEPALMVSYQVTDGGPLDDDGVANGIIVDPAGPATLLAAGGVGVSASAVGAPNTGLVAATSTLHTAMFVLGGATLLAVSPIRRIAYEYLQKRR